MKKGNKPNKSVKQGAMEICHKNCSLSLYLQNEKRSCKPYS